MKKSKSNVVIVIIHQIYYLELTRAGSYREREKEGDRETDREKKREREKERERERCYFKGNYLQQCTGHSTANNLDIIG